MKKFKEIINEELIDIINELLDPNYGEMHLPDNINPRVMRLFEKYKMLYNETHN